MNPFTTRFLRETCKIILHVWWAIARGNKSFSGSSNRCNTGDPILRPFSFYALLTRSSFVLSHKERFLRLPIFLSFRQTNSNRLHEHYIRLRTHPSFFQPIFLRLIARIYSYRPFGKCSISESRTPWRSWGWRREKNR